MSVPHDERAPARNQRFVKCSQDGETALVPFGVYEITDATEDADFETQLWLDLATTDGQTRVAVCGPSVHVATMDYPTYALYDTADGTPQTGEEWGVASGGEKLRLGKPGFTILGDADGITVRVMKDGGRFIAEAELDEDACGEADEIVSVVNAKILPECVDISITEVSNTFKHQGEAGSKVRLIARRCDEGVSWDILDIAKRKICVTHRLDDRESCLVSEQVTIAGEWCPAGEPESACIVVEYIDCEDTLPACDTSVTFDPEACCA